MKHRIFKYLSVFITYFIVDVSYQMIFGISFSTQVQNQAGISKIFAAEPQHLWLMLIWFAIMTFAIVKLAVNPAVVKRSIKSAGFKGLVLGITAYATLAMPNAWSLQDYPLALVGEILLEGALFAPIAASVTTWWILKKNQ